MINMDNKLNGDTIIIEELEKRKLDRINTNKLILLLTKMSMLFLMISSTTWL